MNQLLERRRETFKDEEARYVYADSTVNAFIAAQIKALREDRKFRQEELAALVGTKQSGISRLERADYSSWKVETLRRLARAFGVRLKISFEEFGTLLPDISGFTAAKLKPRKFEDDPAFKEPAPRREGSDPLAAYSPSWFTPEVLEAARYSMAAGIQADVLSPLLTSFHWNVPTEDLQLGPWKSLAAALMAHDTKAVASVGVTSATSQPGSAEVCPDRYRGFRLLPKKATPKAVNSSLVGADVRPLKIPA